MAQKNATPTRAQAAAMRRAGYNPQGWVVIRDMRMTLAIKNRLTRQVKLIDK